MRRFKRHEIVGAIQTVAINVHPDTGQIFVTCDDGTVATFSSEELFAHNKPVVGSYYVQDGNGRISFLPKDKFEAAHDEIKEV